MGYSKYVVNEHFFDTWTPTSAYVLGYIFGDGCVDVRKGGKWPRLRIYAAPGDEQLLQDIKLSMGSNHPVRWQPPGCLVLAFYSRNLYSKVLELGKRPARYGCCVWPRGIPHGVVRDFIRGYIDAEGYVANYNRTQRKLTSKGQVEYKSTYLRLQVVSTDRVIIEGIHRELERIVGLRVKVNKAFRNDSRAGTHWVRRKDLYGIHTAGLSAQSVLDFIHYPGCLCLRRKDLCGVGREA